MLTELPNRLAANERLHSEFVGTKRSDTAYVVLMIDIDHFKRVNDSHGHAVGDQVLQRIARVLRATLRERDFVARFGGEEFLALLPATELAVDKALYVAIAANLVHLVWRDVYRSGNAVIDAPHRALMAQAGELSKHYGVGTLTLGELFAFLARDVVAHHMLVADREFFAHLASKR